LLACAAGDANVATWERHGGGNTIKGKEGVVQVCR